MANVDLLKTVIGYETDLDGVTRYSLPSIGYYEYM